MAFEYNVVDISAVDDVRIESGDISPKTHNKDSQNTNKSKEQKRKSQLVDLLEDDFSQFHEMLVDIMDAYHAPSQDKLILDILNLPNFICCDNCKNKETGQSGEPICKASSVQEDGETLYKIIDDSSQIPRFCSREKRGIRFPQHLIGDVDDKILKAVKAGYEDHKEKKKKEYKTRRKQALEDGRQTSRYITEDKSEFIPTEDEYATLRLNKLLRGLISTTNRERFRRNAIRLSWQIHLGDVLNEEYYPQRGEAYLRAMDSCYKQECTPGQGGDEFENTVRSYLNEAGFPIYDRILNISGGRKKEMDVHTEMPWGDPAIFELFTSGAHNNKETQVQQYSELYKIASGEEPCKFLLTDGYVSNLLSEEMLFDLLKDKKCTEKNLTCPFDPQRDTMYNRNVELVERAKSLNFEDYPTDFELKEVARNKEDRITSKLRDIGYKPFFPIYQRRNCQYGFCGPSIEISTGGDEMILVFYSGREEHPDLDDGRFHSRAKVGPSSWSVQPPHNWEHNLNQAIDKPVKVVEIDDIGLQRLHITIFDGLLTE